MQHSFKKQHATSVVQLLGSSRNKQQKQLETILFQAQPLKQSQTGTTRKERKIIFGTGIEGSDLWHRD